MSTAILCLILVAVAVIAIKGYVKRLSSGCCGSSAEPGVKKVRVKDQNPSHYPYQVQLLIDGMSCSNCTNRVENSLNQLEGVWASVDLGKEQAQVRMKQELSDETLKEAVKAAGYRVYKIRHESVT